MSPWDQLLDRLDHLACSPTALPDDLTTELTGLVEAAMADGMADRELDPADCGRWLATLLHSLHTLQPAEQRADDSLSTLRVVVTRWLHPGRLDPADPLETGLREAL